MAEEYNDYEEYNSQRSEQNALESEAFGEAPDLSGIDKMAGDWETLPMTSGNSAGNATGQAMDANAMENAADTPSVSVHSAPTMPMPAILTPVKSAEKQNGYDATNAGKWGNSPEPRDKESHDRHDNIIAVLAMAGLCVLGICLVFGLKTYWQPAGPAGVVDRSGSQQERTADDDDALAKTGTTARGGTDVGTNASDSEAEASQDANGAAQAAEDNTGQSSSSGKATDSGSGAQAGGQANSGSQAGTGGQAGANSGNGAGANSGNSAGAAPSGSQTQPESGNSGENGSAPGGSANAGQGSGSGENASGGDGSNSGNAGAYPVPDGAVPNGDGTYTLPDGGVFNPEDGSTLYGPYIVEDPWEPHPEPWVDNDGVVHYPGDPDYVPPYESDNFLNGPISPDGYINEPPLSENSPNGEQSGQLCLL